MQTDKRSGVSSELLVVAPGQTSAVSVHVLSAVPLALESFFALFKRVTAHRSQTSCSLGPQPFLVGLALALMLAQTLCGYNTLLVPSLVHCIGKIVSAHLRRKGVTGGGGWGHLQDDMHMVAARL